MSQGKAVMGITYSTQKTVLSMSSANGTACSRPRLLVWSAADAGGANRMVAAYEEYYNSHISGDVDKLDQLAFTLTTRRTLMPWRTYAVVQPMADGTSEATQTGNDMFSENTAASTLSVEKPMKATMDKMSSAFIFTGQGAQYRGMGLELLYYPIYQRSLATSETILARLGCKWSIIGKPISCLLDVIHLFLTALSANAL